jgi:hypothetical protein
MRFTETGPLSAIMTTLIKHWKFRRGKDAITLSSSYEDMLSVFDAQVKEFSSPKCHGLACRNKASACCLTVKVENHRCLPSSRLVSDGSMRISFCDFHLLGYFFYSNSKQQIEENAFFSHCECPSKNNWIKAGSLRLAEKVMCSVCYTTGIERRDLFNSCYQTDFSLEELVRMAQYLYKKNGVATLQEAMDKVRSERPEM